MAKLVFLIILFLCLSKVKRTLSETAETDEILLNYVNTLSRLMSNKTSPCENFYEYVCKGEVNGTFSTFDKVNSAINSNLFFLLEADSDNVEVTTKIGNKIKSFYDSCKILPRGSDGVLHHKDMLKNLIDLPATNEKWSSDSFNFIKAAASLTSLGINSFISFNSVPHYSDPSRHVFLITPERLTKMTPKSEKLNNIIELHLRRTMRAYNLSDSAIDRVVKLEQEAMEIPHTSRKTGAQNSIELDYGQLKKRIPEIDWDIYFNMTFAGVLNDSDLLILWDEQYFHDVILLINRTDPEVLGNFLFSKFAKQFVNLLRRNRDTCVTEVKKYMPDVIGAIFIQNSGNQSYHHEMLKLFSDLKRSFLDLTELSDWMDTETKLGIQRKITAIEPIIGFFNVTSTDQLESEYENVNINQENYLENIKILSKRFNHNFFKNIKEQNKDKLRDLYDPTDSNAGYLNGENRIIIRSGVTHKFVYHPIYPHAVNLGGVGSFIAHEFGHPIDPQCRKFDPEGYMRSWWSNKSVAAYQEHIDCLIDQYDELLNFTEITGVGIHTVQENFADNVGLKVALNLYKKWLQTNKQNQDVLLKEKLPGLQFTDIQLFFVAYTKFHCKLNEGDLSNFIVYSHYSPKEYRVIGSLQNLEEFAEAFNCPVGSRMNPAKKCIVL